MNRLTRDQILVRGLGLIDSPRLDEKDRPAGTIVATALSLGWLQDALDLAHNMFPMSGLLKSATFNIVAGTGTYAISAFAADFVLDFKNGVVLPDDKGRLTRKAFNSLLSVPTSASSQGKPLMYGIQQGSLVLRPVPRDSYTAAVLWYYSLPSVMSAGTIPSFPSDLILVEYVHLRGKEWIRELPSGTAEKYLIDAVARLQKAGLGSEAEADDVIDFDRTVFPGGGSAYQDPGSYWFTQVNA